MSGLAADGHPMAAPKTQGMKRSQPGWHLQAPAIPPEPPEIKTGPSFSDWLANARTAITISVALGSAVAIILWRLWAIEAAIRDTYHRSWTIEDQREFIRRMEKGNPGLMFPDLVEVVRARLSQPPAP